MTDETNGSGAGERTPRSWPADSWPTAAELADWLSRCTHDERLSYADHSLATAQRAARCVDYDHDGQIAREPAAATRARAEAYRDAAEQVRDTFSEDDETFWCSVAEWLDLLAADAREGS